MTVTVASTAVGVAAAKGAVAILIPVFASVLVAAVAVVLVLMTAVGKVVVVMTAEGVVVM